MIDYMVKAFRQARPLMVGIIGISIVVTGIVMIVLPGPGLLLILAGLALLATEFLWAKTLLSRVKGLLGKLKREPKP